MDRLLLKPAEVADAIGVSRTRVYELLAGGTLPSVRVGRSVRVPVDRLREWVKGTSSLPPEQDPEATGTEGS